MICPQDMSKITHNESSELYNQICFMWHEFLNFFVQERLGFVYMREYA
jgi:hypothetical protein